MRPKNASDIDISDSASIFRGLRSPIHSLEKALAGVVAGAPPNFGSPSTKRKSYCLTQDMARSGIGQGLLERRRAAESCACWCDQEGRRSAKTAVASVATSPPPCVISTHQCWRRAVGFDQADVEIERPLRDRRAIIDGERQRIARALRMIDQRPQDGRRRHAAERADKGPVIIAGLPLPAAVAGGNARGVVEQMRGLGRASESLCQFDRQQSAWIQVTKQSNACRGR